MRRILTAVVLVLTLQSPVLGQEADLAAQLRRLDATVFPPETAKEKRLDRMLENDLRARNHAAQRRHAEAFAKLTTKADWEKFRAERVQALRNSLGQLPPLGGDLQLQTARTHTGDGYLRDDIAFVSHGRQVVTANLYRPAQPTEKMPGIVILHGFHQPKTQGELQDMGVNWAKLGCVVLVPDMLGHGERKQHPFVDAQSYPGKFNLPRQDYYSRANAGVQLSLVGESLLGWMAFDAMRCVDLLLSRPGVDRERIIVLGAVAAGGDVAAVAAALDPRITGVAPFNFGGPEPETVYPMPAENAEQAFPYGAGGHWDGTRRLRNAARDGFLPWVVVAAAAPRRLVYAHEFAWDRERDPVWPRLEKVFRWYDAPGNLAFAHGSGTLFGNPEGTGCANIGPVHRAALYPHLQRWFNIPAPTKEVQDRKPANEMQCLTPAIVEKLRPGTIQQAAAERAKLLKPRVDRESLQRAWAAALGATDLSTTRAESRKMETLGTVNVERIALEVERDIVVPLLLLTPPRKIKEPAPVVIGVAQQGKQEFLKERADAIAALLEQSVAVALLDVRGTGETRPAGERRGAPAGTYKGVLANSPSTMLATESLLLGVPLVSEQLRDLRSVVRYLQKRGDLSRVAVWGDSFARVNGADERVEVPWDAEKLPAQAEPLGGLVALLAALFDEQIAAIQVRGGLANYESLLAGPFCHAPHDVIVPGALAAGDVKALTEGLGLRPARVVGAVDGRNRRVTPDADGKDLAAWLKKQLKR